MALIFVDGFDSYSADADLATKWDQVDTTEFNFGSTIGRFGAGGLLMIDDAADLGKSFPVSGTLATTDELIFSYSIKTNVYPPTSDDTMIQFVSLFNNDQLSLNMTGTGVLTVRRGNQLGTLLGSSGTVMSIGLWQRVEVQAVLRDGTDGSVKVVVDGTTVIDLSGIDTKDSSGDPDGANNIRLGGPNSTTGWTIDDVVIHNTGGDEPTALLGDLEIQTLRPDGTGDQNDSTAVGAATRWQAVDESGVNDGDTTYVSMTTAGDEDLYSCANLSGSPTTIHAVVVNNVARSDGSDPRNLAALVKEGTTEGQAATLKVPSGSIYFTMQGYFPENPDTALAWIASEVDGMQLGQKVVT